MKKAKAFIKLKILEFAIRFYIKNFGTVIQEYKESGSIVVEFENEEDHHGYLFLLKLRDEQAAILDSE